ncbi:BTAD domain-containing putative transcriptional regulator [Catellatospora sp. KI3]|uniref:AfsR/SARP family transcriptional regulator n=1 Tax=Catellatospora sp. KI3 TaxID=3041620 RepID=UPI0024821A19|nr:BTAD domain-containing putative transcriptional regulator [Catellatospora sp. KI3]MDI1463199.1 BTAD domain-containing putative transcriptional regulator [Catellatospora sp. KI3]
MSESRVRVLGPIEASGTGGPAALIGARQRALLAVLAMNAGTVVHQPRLIDALWGWDPPRTAVKTLHSHIARVRQALDACGLNGALSTQHTGYRLDIPAQSVDAHLFESAVASARARLDADDPDRAAAELREALLLWRGDALADGEPTGWAAAEAARLNEVRLCAIEQLWDAELRLGRHRQAVGELERLLVDHPHRERVVELYMLALHRCGRPADALEAYRRLRVHLADELGADPGPALQRLHTAVLREDPALAAPAAPVQAAAPQVPAVAAGPRPAQLPALAGHFTGREAQLSALDTLLAGQRRIGHIAGPAGMGKSALAVQWAHRAAPHFPDGQIFLDLGGHDPVGALDPAEALAHVLTSLGVAENRLPAAPAARAALYRGLVHERRVLLVLDDAADAEQVLPLVPAGGASLLLVTSRHQPTALATHHDVRAVDLGALDRHEAVALLARVLGEQRVRAEPEAAAELADLCDRMPLALRIAAAKLAARPGRALAELNNELNDEDRLDELAVPGDARSVRAVFAGAYRALSPAAARLFRLLGQHPGPVFGAGVAQAALGERPGPARRALAELLTAHLVTEEAPGRHRLHDLLRLYARERAETEDGAAERTAAAGRIVDWYLGVADAANRIVDPGRDRVRPQVARPAEFADHHAALAFLDGERPNLLPVVSYAARHGHATAAWQLTYLLTGFYDSRGHWGDRVLLCRQAVGAAQVDGDPAAEGLMRSAYGVALIQTHRHDEAIDALQGALALMRRCGDQRGEGHVHNNIAVACAGLRRFDEAVEAYQQALALHTGIDNRLGIALSLNNIGDAYVRMGRPELSDAYLTRALALSRELPNARLEAAALSSLGQSRLARGELADALSYLHQALAVRRLAGDRRYEADTRTTIGTAHLRGGDHDAALAEFEQALALSQELADQHLESVALASIGRVHLHRPDPVAAGGFLHLALALRSRAPDPYETACVLRDLAALADLAGDRDTAAEHRQHAIDLYRKANALAEADALAGLD